MTVGNVATPILTTTLLKGENQNKPRNRILILLIIIIRT